MPLHRPLFPGHCLRAVARPNPPHIRIGKPVAGPGTIIIVAHVGNACNQQVLWGYGVAKVGDDFGRRNLEAGLDRPPLSDVGAQLLAFIDQFARRLASDKP